MCRWGCATVDTTFKCKWCGTRFCRACLRGDFTGCMWEPGRCRVCNQVKCTGERVEYVERSKQPTKTDSLSSKKRGKSSKSTRPKSNKSGRSSKSSKSKKGKKKK
ncbi:uncharacterized protein LOC117124435 [Anneissia japonica]|uniref:uncharacterized protein LOC117124435 n=1 Tax=Anneissia japonica TaxID=1529436 RepID=UPI00142562E2|nr:uncharacterized protein LOC117124435 [Anneissia japonica]